MGFLTSLFGGENAVVTMIIALVAVIVLIVLAVWALKLVFGASGRVARGRNKRLAVVDLAPVDQKRQLVLIRRDGVEHLLMIGGAHDLVIETGIPVEEEAAAARPPRRGVPAIVRPRAKPQAEEPAPAPLPREAAFAPEPALAPAPPMEKRAASGPAPVARPEPEPEPVLVPMEDPAVEHSPADVERLKELGKPLAERKLGQPQSERRRPSLRQTGLLRPVTRVEPSLIPTPDEKFEPPLGDSDMNETGKKAGNGVSADEVHIQADDDGAGEARTAQGKK